MPCTAQQPDPVPLNIWPCAGSHASADPIEVRRELTRRVVDAYSLPGGTVIDLAPAESGTVQAATHAGRNVVAVVPSLAEAARHITEVGSRQRQTVAAALADLADTADLVLLVSPAAQLAPGGGGRGFSATTVRIACNMAAPLLRPGGFLVVVVAGGTSASCPAHEIVRGADTAGLSFFQHVVALLVPVGPDALVVGSGGRATGRPRRAHADVLVFARRDA